MEPTIHEKPHEKHKAILYAGVEPTATQKQRFLAFLEKKYGFEFELEWEEDDQEEGGFKLVADKDVYDWTNEGRFRQLIDRIEEQDRKAEGGDIISLIKGSIEGFAPHANAEEEGIVASVGDGIVIVDGLGSVKYGEIVVFESGVRGMVQDLRRDEVGVILFGDDTDVTEGSRVHRTKKTAGIPVGEDYIGRVINALGEPVDGEGPIHAADFRAIEEDAPGIIQRQPVNEPMYTGILTIDSMFPIGKGQRELIIGDRQTGKTAITVDTILNQKGKNVLCIYVAIGQKASSVAQLVEILRKNGAMDYTIVVNASAAESAPIQYIAPYAGAAMAEYFMYKGRDVLIIYDDLSKHAIAYRALSLLLERSPGREAYPGDVFYLHSRLLERAAHLSEELGGGSMTALPVVETQAGDVSAYIPTNIISITDGQIFLESDLFFAGQRPAVNVGLSVSRVGGAAQKKAMKKAAGSIRLDLAQYREMAVFTQFSSDLDESTRRQLDYGNGLMQLLRQPQSHPFSLAQQVVTLVAATSHKLTEIPVNDMQKFRTFLLEQMAMRQSGILDKIEQTGELSDEDKEQIIAVVVDYVKQYMDMKASEKE